MKRHYILVLLVLLMSCSGGELVSEPVAYIDINPDSNNRSDELTEKVEKISLVKLESDQDFLIGSISQVVFSEDQIVILDSEVTQAVFVFDHKGRKRFTIKNKGEGPGKYRSATNIMIKNKHLVLFDKLGGKFLLYNNSNGKYLSEFKIMGSVVSMAEKNNYLYGFANNIDNRNIKVFDMEGNKLKEYFPTPGFLRNKRNFVMKKNLSSNKEELLLMNAFNNNIYTLQPDSITIKYKVRFGKYEIPESVLRSVTNKTINEVINDFSKEYAFGIDYLLDTDDFLSFCFIYKGTHFTLYNKKNGHKITIALETMPKEWSAVFRFPESAAEMGAVSFISAPELIRFTEMDVAKIKVLEDLKQQILLTKATINDNPYLLITRFRSF